MNGNSSSSINSYSNNPNNYIPYSEPERDINLVPKRRLFRRPGFVGVFFSIIGIIIGGLGCFGIMKVVSDNNPDNCNYPTLPDTAGKTLALNTNFLKMELDNNNVVYSPLSIRYGLSLLGAGASGETKIQIENIVGDEDLPVYENVPDTLSLANALFIGENYKDAVSQSYIKKATNIYSAEIIYDSFNSSENMDNWVNQKTFGLIDKIGLQPNSNTEMVLANALAIQMDWQHKFNTNDTFGMTFYKNDDSEVLATIMKMDASSEDISYHKDNNVTMLKLPLVPTTDTALEFVAIMPSSNLADYIDTLDFKDIDAMLKDMTPASEPEDGLKIYIPKFKFDYALDFKHDLEEMGMTNAFDAEIADFSKILTTDQAFYVSDAVHKANIDFSEEGIKAAAVTALAMNEAAMVDEREPEPVVINIDKPFYFIIRDSIDNVVWFAGAVYEPNLWENDMASYQVNL